MYTYINFYSLCIVLPLESDFGSAPLPSQLITIRRGQEMVCSNITINDDLIVEVVVEQFIVFLDIINTTFSAGVTLMPDNAVVEIVDNDGKR